MITHISTVKDLNALIMSVGQVDPDKIISHLIDKKLIVSNEIMKLITNPSLHCQQYHQKQS